MVGILYKQMIVQGQLIKPTVRSTDLLVCQDCFTLIRKKPDIMLTQHISFLNFSIGGNCLDRVNI